jgi:hypothetical protein
MEGDRMTVHQSLLMFRDRETSEEEDHRIAQYYSLASWEEVFLCQRYAETILMRQFGKTDLVIRQEDEWGEIEGMPARARIILMRQDDQDKMVKCENVGRFQGVG